MFDCEFLCYVFHSGDEQSLPSRCEMFAITRNPDGTISIQNDTRVPCSRWEYQMDSYTNTLTNQVSNNS